jgi:hypothetical protein
MDNAPRLPPVIKQLFDTINIPITHPLDWQRFYDFVRACHFRRQKRLLNGGFFSLLCSQGVPEESAKRLDSIFNHCYKILSTPIPLRAISVKAAEVRSASMRHEKRKEYMRPPDCNQEGQS